MSKVYFSKKTKNNRKVKNKKLNNLTNGPGKLCQALKIDKELNNYDLINGNKLYVEKPSNNIEYEIKKDKRVNIDYAEEYKDKLWRFYIKDNSFVSKNS